MIQHVRATLYLLIMINSMNNTEALCYFPQDFQGDYVMQSSAGAIGNDHNIQYNTLNITENSIPIWGNCHRRIGNNFILMFNYSETSCIRCLYLKLRSSSILQVFASNQETISKCFTNEESAEANCPSDESIASGRIAEILLFKTRDVLGEFTPKQYCPIDGKFTFKYKSNAPKTSKECFGFGSIADSCPSGSTMNFRPRNCTDISTDLNFDCLAHWKGHNDETYIVFSDSTRETTHSNKQRPLYRCGIYKQEKATGKIYMTLGVDSTCTNDLHNATTGYETFELEPILEKPWPLEVSFAMCIFPKWMQGNWEHLKVENNTMIYRDHTSYKTYTIKCVGLMEDGERYLVFTRTQCDEEFYTCLRIANRSNNILEFQIGRNSSNTDNDVFALCSEDNFQEDAWITQGREDIAPGFSSGMCPITGEYTGVIPDATDLCANLWSDCRAPELMYYQVSHCKSGEIYEEREYQCLGHWREMNLLYTYTQRNDVASGTHECFVGSIITDKDIYIKEAGGPCQRNVDPLQYGMQLTKKQSMYSCIERSTTPRYIPRLPTEEDNVIRPSTTPMPRRTTPSLDFDMGTNNENNNIITNAANSPTNTISCCYYHLFLYVYILFL